MRLAVRLRLLVVSSKAWIEPACNPALCVCLQVGASQKIACVIDGESLMNDGSALVIFLVLQKIVEGQPVTIGGVSSNIQHSSKDQPVSLGDRCL